VKTITDQRQNELGEGNAAALKYATEHRHHSHIKGYTKPSINCANSAGFTYKLNKFEFRASQFEGTPYTVEKNHPRDNTTYISEDSV
jgi:hypothetical protein